MAAHGPFSKARWAYLFLYHPIPRLSVRSGLRSLHQKIFRIIPGLCQYDGAPCPPSPESCSSGKRVRAGSVTGPEDRRGYHRSGQFYCSEAIVKTINDEFGLGYPEEVVRLASGFPIGIGGAGRSCGAVTGGVMAIGMVFGRDQPKDPRIDRCLCLSRELHNFFASRHGCLCCRSLTRGMVLKSPEHMQQCIAFTGKLQKRPQRSSCGNVMTLRVQTVRHRQQTSINGRITYASRNDDLF